LKIEKTNSGLKVKKVILSNNDSLDQPDDTIRISVDSFKHAAHIYKQYNLIPEDQLSIEVPFVLQRTNQIRRFIKEMDILLAVDGKIKIVLYDCKAHASSLRSVHQVMCEFSLATNGRYCLVEKDLDNDLLELTYRKHLSTNPKSDTIQRWTFGIVSDGRHNDWVRELIGSVSDQRIPEFEILICGPSPYAEVDISKPNYVKIIDDVLLDDDIRAPISHKKNAIIKNAGYNNLCILHDRYLLPTDWYKKFQEYGNYYDAICLKTISKKGKRFGVDWMKFYHPLSDRFKINRPMLYNEWHEEAIIPGGVMVLKKSLIDGFMLDERLHWGEMEDLHLSKVAMLNGIYINVDSNNYFISRQVRHNPKNYSWFELHVYEKALWIRTIIVNWLKYKIIINRYNRLQKR